MTTTTYHEINQIIVLINLVQDTLNDTKKNFKDKLVIAFVWFVLFIMLYLSCNLMAKTAKSSIIIKPTNYKKFKERQIAFHQFIAQLKDFNNIDKQSFNWFWQKLFTSVDKINSLVLIYSTKLDIALEIVDKQIAVEIANLTTNKDFDLENLGRGYKFNRSAVIGKLECEESAEDLVKLLNR
jgi:hypothetical protein